MTLIIYLKSPVFNFAEYIPLVLISWLAIAPPCNLLSMSLQSLVTAIILLAIARIRIWSFLLWWTPYVYGILFVVTLVIVLRRQKLQRKFPASWLGWIAVIAFVAFGVVAGNEAIGSRAGPFPPSITAVDLAFPLRGSNYLILNGGSDI